MFLFYAAFDSLSLLNLPNKTLLIIEQLGMSAHFVALSKGVLDTRDLLYFFSLSAFFLALTKTVLEARKW